MLSVSERILRRCTSFDIANPPRLGGAFLFIGAEWSQHLGHKLYAKKRLSYMLVQKHVTQPLLP